MIWYSNTLIAFSLCKMFSVCFVWDVCIVLLENEMVCKKGKQTLDYDRVTYTIIN
jgi:hypothetical protein